MSQKKKFWKFCNQAGRTVELLLYGDIAQTSWWGDEATPRQFAEELADLGALDEIVVRINSGGGDVFAAQAIGNQLEQHPANVIAKIDGLCASAATIVACHCNSVIAANDSTYMVYPVRIGTHGYYDAEELQKYLEALTAIRESIVGLYVKKTGQEREKVAEWMDSTSWWTAEQAKEHGFVDELVDSETEVENRDGLLFINSVNTHLSVRETPDFLKKKMANHKEDKTMEHKIKTADDLRQAYPELVSEIAKAAENAERQRIQDIEEMALPGSEKLTNEAKFIKPVSASDYAKAAMKRAKEQGASYLDAAKKEAESISKVTSTAPENGIQDSFLNAIKAANR